MFSNTINKIKTKKNGVTIIELLFSIFIISTLAISLISSINFIISKNKYYSARLNAFLIADNYFNTNTPKTAVSKINEVEYKFFYDMDTEKASEFLQNELYKFELERYELPVKTVKVQWSLNNENFEITLKRITEL